MPSKIGQRMRMGKGQELGGVELVRVGTTPKTR